ncbi:MAG: YicC/YloC family endoribonuclease [Pseudomonadota bacterium]
MSAGRNETSKSKDADGPTALHSMTGFGQSEGDFHGRTWVWEGLSVNGRGLEARFRLPKRQDRLEASCRKALSHYAVRGNFSFSLTVDAGETEANFTINRQALDAAIDAVKNVSERLECAPPRPEGILALKGVIDVASGDDTLEDAQSEAEFEQALLDGFEACVVAITETRRVEGTTILEALAAQLDQIEDLNKRAAALSVDLTKTIRDRWKEQLTELLQTESLTEDRIIEEAAIQAVKADTREEIDRISAHCAAARDLLSGGGPVGRRLDFLCQEFNREANTLCAKAPTLDLKNTGLEMKVAIDQVREQVQNLE